MSSRRVAVTGVGVVSAIGLDAASYWASLVAGRSGIGPIQSIDIGDLKFRHAAEVRGFDARLYFSEKDAAQLDRFVHFAYAAAKQALDDAGVQPPEKTAVITGCSTGGMHTRDQNYRELYGEGKTRYNPLTIPRVMESAAASLISMRLGVRGPVFNVTSACASSNHAIGQALLLMQAGRADAAIAGGSEAMLSMAMLRAWEAMRVVAPDTCRPFSKDRLGMVLGEGAGMLMLEDWDVARARGARIYCELAGCGMNADAGHWTQPSQESAMRAMREAGVALDEVGYVNAHGTGTPLNDPVEAEAIAEVFGAKHRPAVSSTKSMHGHALGASGGLEAVATVMAMHHGVLPPTANLTELDPACGRIDVATEARTVKVKAALSNSLAFGGLNCVLGFRAVP